MLNFTDVAIRRGPRLLFSGATFSLFRGEKVGITGENGSGKTSLLALVRGDLQADAGNFEMPSQLAIAHVSQELLATDRQAIEFVLDGDPELRALERDIEAATAMTEEASDDGTRLGELYARYGWYGDCWLGGVLSVALLIPALLWRNSKQPAPQLSAADVAP